MADTTRISQQEQAGNPSGVLDDLKEWPHEFEKEADHAATSDKPEKAPERVTWEALRGVLVGCLPNRAQ